MPDMRRSANRLLGLIAEQVADTDVYADGVAVEFFEPAGDWRASLPRSSGCGRRSPPSPPQTTPTRRSVGRHAQRLHLRRSTLHNGAFGSQCVQFRPSTTDSVR